MSGHNDVGFTCADVLREQKRRTRAEKQKSADDAESLVAAQTRAAQATAVLSSPVSGIEGLQRGQSIGTGRLGSTVYAGFLRTQLATIKTYHIKLRPAGSRSRYEVSRGQLCIL